jgi:hypothetical protein
MGISFGYTKGPQTVVSAAAPPNRKRSRFWNLVALDVLVLRHRRERRRAALRDHLNGQACLRMSNGNIHEVNDKSTVANVSAASHTVNALCMLPLAPDPQATAHGTACADCNRNHPAQPPRLSAYRQP